jgi:hypothetical protein
MKNQQKIFKTERGAQNFAEKLKKAGKLDIQIWEIPGDYEKSIYAVLWYEN